MKVCIITPNLASPGGVSYLYKVIQKDKKRNYEYFELKKKGNVKFEIVLDFLRLTKLISKYDVFVLNPSLDLKAFLRDAILSFLFFISGKSYVIYWHGWQSNFQNRIKHNWLLRVIFKYSYNKANCQIVLANKFGVFLREIGYTRDIEIFSNTCFFPKSIGSNKIDEFNMLYISRIEELKGWDIAISTMKYLEDLSVRLNVVGDGSCLANAKKLISDLGIKNVTLHGYLDGNMKYNIFEKSQISFFPTCYPEGMPLALLEGGSYGHIIITREEGGIKDHLGSFNGEILSSKNPQDFAVVIRKIIEDNNFSKKMIENHILAKRNYSIPSFMKRYEITIERYG